MRDEDGFAAPSAPSMSDEIEASEEDTELTAHEYARECGLCTDYLMDNPMLILPLGFSQCKPAAGFKQSKPEPFETPTEDLEDPEGATQHEVTADDLTRERLDIDLETRELLFSIMQDEEDSFLHSLPDFTRLLNDLRLEPPLLTTGDHEVDVLHFGHRPSPDFAKMNLPMEHTERERDEGMEWPTRYLDLPQRVERKYGAEKLEFPREGVEFLMGVMRDEWSPADMEEVYTSEMTYTKVRVAVRMI